MHDIVFPNNNEQEFLDMAKQLGFDSLIFVYPLNKHKENHAILASPNELYKAKKLSKIILCNSNERNIFESNCPNVVFELENISKVDSLHFRYSGLNHILCNLAKKNNISIGISFSLALRSKGMLRSQILGRMEQNIMLARKYGLKTIVASFARSPSEIRSAHDLRSFALTLGMTPEQVKHCFSS
ncbi:MAG: RNase P subunit p30 family protein [Candidatus Woesearchaeota archaeon]